jgi:hypothetical protein
VIETPSPWFAQERVDQRIANSDLRPGSTRSAASIRLPVTPQQFGSNPVRVPRRNPTWWPPKIYFISRGSVWPSPHVSLPGQPASGVPAEEVQGTCPSDADVARAGFPADGREVHLGLTNRVISPTKPRTAAERHERSRGAKDDKQRQGRAQYAT